MILTWNPPNHGVPIIFSRDAEDYRLLLNYSGLAPIPGEHVYAERAPGRHGRIRKYTTLTERAVSFDVMVLSTDLEDQQAKVQALAAAFNPIDGPGILHYEKEDGTVYYLNCIGAPGNPAVSGTEKDAMYQEVTIMLVADEDPFWHSGSPSIVYLDPNPPDFFPFAFPFSLTSTTSTKTCTNTGSIDAPIIVTFNGPMTNPKLTCTREVAGATVTETLSATIEMVAGDVLVVNTDPDVMTAVYTPAVGEAENAHKYIDTTATFWRLGRGNNTVHLDPSASSSGASASVMWSDRYVGV